MVKNPGETPGVGTIRPLNPPVPTGVVEDEHGKPVAVAIGAGQPPAVPHKGTPARTGGQALVVPHKSAPTTTGVQGTESPPGFGVSPNSSLSPSRSGRGVGQPPAVLHKSTGGRTGVQGTGAPGDTHRHGRRASPPRGVSASPDFSFLGAGAEQSPSTGSLDHMLAETGVQGTESPESGLSPDSSLSPSRSGRGAGRALRVTAIEDQWEIDEEWWRSRPVSRMYYRVLLEDGQALTLYRDMLNGRWYRQRY